MMQPKTGHFAARLPHAGQNLHATMDAFDKMLIFQKTTNSFQWLDASPGGWRRGARL